MYRQMLYKQMNIEEVIKSSAKLSLEKKTVINILYTDNWLKEQLLPFFKSCDVSMEQYNVLRILRGQKGSPANLNTIQERMISKMSNTTRLVDKLISKGLVTRYVCEQNRRKVEIYITEEGMKFLKETEDELNIREKNSMRGLTEAELITLNDLLDKIRN